MKLTGFNIRNMSSRLVFFISIACALAMILLVNPGKKTHKSNTNPDSRFPEYIAVEPITVQYNSNGQINHHFRGKLFTHYQDEGTTEVLKPEIVIYRNQDDPWEVTANKGTIYMNGENVLLEGNVAILQKDENTSTELLTESLKLSPDEKYAETDKPVIINTALSHTRATGMQAWLDREYIELLSKVSGHHAFKQ